MATFTPNAYYADRHQVPRRAKRYDPSTNLHNPLIPIGTFYRYDAKAIGSGSEGAQAELQSEYHRSLTLEEAETLVLKTLKQVMEEKLDSKNVQLASVTREQGFRIYGDDEMSSIVERLEGA